MLGNINFSLIDRFIQRVYNGNVSKVPTIDYLGPKPEALPKLTGFAKVQSMNEITYTIGDSLPDRSAWLQTLAGPNLSWLRVLPTSITIVQGTSYIDNPIHCLL